MSGITPNAPKTMHASFVIKLTHSLDKLSIFIYSLSDASMLLLYRKNITTSNQTIPIIMSTL
jgi:hypothetical protein